MDGATLTSRGSSQQLGATLNSGGYFTGGFGRQRVKICLQVINTVKSPEESDKKTPQLHLSGPFSHLRVGAIGTNMKPAVSINPEWMSAAFTKQQRLSSNDGISAKSTST